MVLFGNFNETAAVAPLFFGQISNFSRNTVAFRSNARSETDSKRVSRKTNFNDWTQKKQKPHPTRFIQGIQQDVKIEI
jgi:hypothetical protein